MYDLHTLGWNDFQQLCLTISREVLGQTVESFLDSGDGGRDGAFVGQWCPRGKEVLSGRFVIQCKFTSKRNYTLKTSDLSDEVSKVQELVARGLCDAYMLMTNAGLSGTTSGTIEALFKSAGAKHVVTYGSTWICQQIRESKRLRMLVPRMYGLGDLSQILDERAYTQARVIIESMREELGKVVVTDAYQRAADAMDKHGFVLLIGEPAAGKTTIASLLAMAALDQWNASTLKLDHPGNLKERWNPNEPSQFFWLDDAFGVTQYEESLVQSWNHILPQINTMLRKGARIVMTSRDYIYNRARSHLKESAFPLLKENQVVIDVRDLSADEKRQILYNHLKLGKQPVGFRTEIKPHLEAIASHPRFFPETARRLADPLFTKDLFIDAYYLSQFVEKREQLLQEIIHGLDAASKAALALIYLRSGRLASPLELQPIETQAIERLGSDLGKCVAALEALKGSLVVFSHFEGESVWQFKHPTISDAFATVLVQSPEHLGIFVQGSTPERLIRQVTCGDVGIEKAVIIPKPLFSRVLQKLENISAQGAYKSESLRMFSVRESLQRFLARRCSKDFLATYLERHPEIIQEVSKPGLFLYAVPEVALAERLHGLGLLPEEAREQFVETVSEYAVNGEDADALDDDGIRTLFTDGEFEELLHRIRTELLPRLAEIRRDWEWNLSTGESREEHMDKFLRLCTSVKERFAEEEEIVRQVDREEERAKEWIEDGSNVEEPKRSPRELGKVESRGKSQGARSIFDDIDADDGSADG